MPVNFSQLANIAPPQAMGTVPVINRPNPLNELAGGIMTGALQGQQMQQNAQQMRATQQQMDQNKQLFPSQLQQEQQKAAMGAIDLKTKQGQYAYSQNLKKAAAISEQTYFKALSPDDQQKYLLDKANVKAKASEIAKNYAEADEKKGAAAKNYADANKSNADADKTGAEAFTIKLNNQQQLIHNAALIYQHASGIQDPQAREQAYQDNLAIVDAATQKFMPPHYDPQKANSTMQIDHENHADALQRQSEETKAKTEVKPTSEEQNAKALTGYKDQFDKASPGSPEQVEAANNYNNLADQLKNQNSKLWGLLGSKFGSTRLTPGKPSDNKPVAEVPKGRIAVVGPDGKQYHLPKEQLKEAIKQGYKPLGQ